MPTFPDFQSARSNHTFTFHRSGINTPASLHLRAANPPGEATKLNRTRAHSAIQEKKTWPLELQRCFCWASSAFSCFQVGTSNLFVVTHLLLAQTGSAPVSHVFRCLPAAQILQDCCKTASPKKLPLQVIASYRIQEEGRGCDIKATV